MNINRDNYEMFFLLYVDNELSAREKQAVEAFIGLNPDLGKELSILKETVLPIDDLSFGNKAELFKSPEKDALQEKMLLHLDHELDETQGRQFEQELLSSNILKSEWEILQKTKLDASEVILFPGKKSLYRHERRRVVVMRFTRMAIAAAFIGAGLFFGYQILNRQDNVEDLNPVASKPGKIQPGLSSTPLADHSKPKSAEEDDKSTPDNNVLISQSSNTITSIRVKPDPKPVSEKLESNKIRKDQVVQEEVELSRPSLALNNPNRSVEKISPERTSEEMEIAKMNRISRPEITDVNLTAVENTMARTAGITNLEEPNDDKILYIDEEKVTRTKAAGFLRKLKRTVERNTRIKTGNGLRIAGFEFAVK